MGRIRLLPEEVASQVAAGEVVERPASVVKELVENSLDSGARTIQIAIRRGGMSSIVVTDDGTGMDRDDALLSLERHATSKIRTGDDLASVATLGFRGEALPSIASVSRFRLATRQTDAVGGTEIVVNGGRIESVRDTGIAPGTRIEVRSLFYNLPARRKFLRTEHTEAAHIENLIQLLALGHPDTAFLYHRDEKPIFHLAAASSLLTRIRDLVGDDLAARLLPVEDRTVMGIRFHGFLGPAGLSRSDRSRQLVFVNGRAVDAREITYALREGYHTALMRGQFPVTFLFVTLDPGEVDVNVHPAKREVRFRNPRAVREAVVELVRQTLAGGRSEWAATALSISPPTAPSTLQQPRLLPENELHVLRRDWSEFPAPDDAPSTAVPDARPGSEPRAAARSLPEDATPGAFAPRTSNPSPNGVPQPVQAAGDLSPRKFRVLGVLAKLYILMEGRDGLVLVDQHAAHERILFEQMQRRLEENAVPSQRLLLPITLQVSPKEYDWMQGNRAALERMGIGIEEFGANTFKVDSLPPFLRHDDPEHLVRRLLQDLQAVSRSTSSYRLAEDIIARTVCRHAVKANDTLREPEIDRLLDDLMRCELPYCCPHGRPTIIQISFPELERKFGRIAPG